MRKPLSPILFALLVGLIGPGGVSAQSRYADLDAAVQEVLDRGVSGSLHGLGASVHLPDGTIRSYGAGVRRAGEPIDTTRAFFFASYTKMLTSVVLLQLVDEGSVSLDAAVNDVVATVPNVPADETLRSLLQHRSRLGLYLGSALQAVQQHPDSVFETRSTLAAHLAPANRNAARGFDYNDSNFQVAGLVAEELTGVPGGDLFESRIFGPAGADFAELAPSQPDTDRINGAWVNGSVDVGAVNPAGFLSASRYAAGVLGTTRDMLKVLVALHSGTFLRPETLALMQTGSTANASYGLGMMSRQYGGFRLYGHGGGLVHSSRTFFDPVNLIGVSVAANEDTDLIEQLMVDLFAAVRANPVSVSVEGGVDLVAGWSLEAYPNPAVGQASVAVEVPRAGVTRVMLFDLLGRKRLGVFSGNVEAGSHRFGLDVADLASGVYVLRMEGAGESVTRVVIVGGR